MSNRAMLPLGVVLAALGFVLLAGDHAVAVSLLRAQPPVPGEFPWEPAFAVRVGFMAILGGLSFLAGLVLAVRGAFEGEGTVGLTPPKIVAETVAGAVGGALAWVATEPSAFLSTDPAEAGQIILPQPAFGWSTLLFGAILGGCIGVCLGFVEGAAAGSRKKLRSSVTMAWALGVVGGAVALYFAQEVYGRLAPTQSSSSTLVGPFVFLMAVLARTIGWGILGALLGAAQAAGSASTRRIRNGLIGGAIGGMLGGFLFELLGQILGAPPLSRLVGMVITGAFIGFFIGLVHQLLKQAWVRVLRGRNEGREFVLDKPINVLGRDELADVGVFGDAAVAPKHAAIKRGDAGAYIVEDLGASPAGTLLNGQRVSTHGLADGDVIQLGGTRIEFHEKVGRAPVRRALDVVAPTQTARAPAVPEGICAFCGQTKDPRTGACACTPVAPPAPGFAAAAEGAGAAWAPSAPGAPSFGPSVVSGAPSFGAPSAPAAPMGSGPRLVWLSGPLSGQVTPVAAAETSIGREVGRDVVLAGDATVSRRHAVVRSEGAAYEIADEGSANGTYVNGARVAARQMLRSGDRVRLGQAEFVFEC